MPIAGARAAGPEDAIKAVNNQLAQLEMRMVDQYARSGDHLEDEVRNTFQQAQARFSNATVHTFLPILIERRVKAAFASYGS